MAPDPRTFLGGVTMDLLTVAIGAAAIAFGIITLFLRFLNPGMFKKLVHRGF
jgi:hypothetical protein